MEAVVQRLETTLAASPSVGREESEPVFEDDRDSFVEDVGNIDVVGHKTLLSPESYRRRTVDKNLEKQLALVTKYTIFETRHGSHAYGTNLPTSDIDKKGICLIPTSSIYRSFASAAVPEGEKIARSAVTRR